MALSIRYAQVFSHLLRDPRFLAWDFTDASFCAGLAFSAAFRNCRIFGRSLGARPKPDAASTDHLAWNGCQDDPLLAAALMDALHQDYIITASARGVPPKKVTYRHALRNALIPVVTVIGLQMGDLFGGPR